MTDLYHIKAELAMQYEHGWTVAQENFKRYLHDQNRNVDLTKSMRKRYKPAAVAR